MILTIERSPILLSLIFFVLSIIILGTYDIIYRFVGAIYHRRTLHVIRLPLNILPVRVFIKELQTLTVSDLFCISSFLVVSLSLMLIMLYVVLFNQKETLPYLFLPLSFSIAIIFSCIGFYRNTNHFAVKSFQSIFNVIICFMFLFIAQIILSYASSSFSILSNLDVKSFHVPFFKLIPITILFFISSFFLLNELYSNEHRLWGSVAIGKFIFYIVLCLLSLQGVFFLYSSYLHETASHLTQTWDVITFLQSKISFMNRESNSLFIILLLKIAILWIALLIITLLFAVLHMSLPSMNANYRLNWILWLCIPLIFVNIFIIGCL